MPYGWEGPHVRLAPLDKAKHLANAQLWMNDPEITAWTLVGDFPLSLAAQEVWLDERASGKDPTHVFFAIETLAGEHLGFNGLHQIDYRHGVATTGTVLGRKDLWGKGYGAEASDLRTRYAFEVLGLRLLMSGVMADNVGSLRMLAKAGYKECGRIPRRWWKRGAWRDEVMMVLERPGTGET